MTTDPDPAFVFNLPGKLNNGWIVVKERVFWNEQQLSQVPGSGSRGPSNTDPIQERISIRNLMGTSLRYACLCRACRTSSPTVRTLRSWTWASARWQTRGWPSWLTATPASSPPFHSFTVSTLQGTRRRPPCPELEKRRLPLLILNSLQWIYW